MKNFLSHTLVLSLMAFATAPAGAATLAELQKGGEVRMGFANEAPYSFSKPDGSLAGTDYETAKVIFGKLGVAKLEGVLVNFGALIPGLKARRFDVVAAGLYIRPERCTQVAFADPHIVVGDGVLVAKGNPKNIHSYADAAKNPAIKLSAAIGGAVIKNAIAAGVAKEQIVEFPDWISALAALKAGRIDGALQTRVTALATLKSSNDPSIEIAEPFVQPVVDGKPAVNYAAFAFNPEDVQLRDTFNAELKKFVGTSAYAAILAKYDLTPHEIPQGITAVEICKK